MDDQTQFINVVFDPNFQSFDQDLASMSLDKMMSIQFSEDVLQKNFSVIITILKQLHRGLVVMNGKVDENSNWVTELKKVSEATELKDRMTDLENKLKDYATKEELHQVKNQLQNILRDQDDQIRELGKLQDEQKTKLALHDNEISKHDLAIKTINDDLDDLRKQIKDLGEKVLTLEKQSEIKAEIVKQNEAMPQQQQQQISTIQSQPGGGISDQQLKDILDRLAKLESQLGRPTIQTNNNQSDKGGEGDFVDLSEINRKLNTHEDDIQKLYELLDDLKKKLRESNTGAGGPSGIDDEELLQLKNDIKKLFATVEQLQTQLNLTSFGGAGGEGGDISENQMAIILAEINKLRQQFGDYATKGDLANETQRTAHKIKQCYDHIEEEIEKVRREFKNKLDKKVEQADIQKLINEFNQLKDFFNKHRKDLQNSNVDSPSIKGPQLDPDFLQTFKDLQEQVQQIEQELINHKSQFTQYSHQITNKVQELEKKIQGFQTDKIFQELSNLRELCDKLKSDSDQNKTKLKEFKNRIDQFITKEEMIGILDPRLKQIKDELIKLIEELKNKLERKADIDDLQNIEQKYMTKLEEVVNALIKQLANKGETKKALIYLEQKINQIFMILEGEGGSKDADGLFAKKQVWSCASCDKELDKYNGQLGEYKKWAIFPPKETSPERMGRFGTGFKVMQEKQKGNREKQDKERYTQQGQQNQERPNSQMNQQFYQTGNMSQSQTQLPKINKQQ